MWGGAFRSFSCFASGGRSQSRDKSQKDGSQPALNGSTVGGGVSFKALPGHIVPPDRLRRMEFAGGCQKVSSPRERSDPLFTGLCRAPAPFVLLLRPCSPPAFLTPVRPPGPKKASCHAPSPLIGCPPPAHLCLHTCPKKPTVTIAEVNTRLNCRPPHL